MALKSTDPQVYEIIKNEEKRQQESLSMIPSENFFSPAVREAVGSVLSHKYSEGNIGRRYYEGNEYIDQVEQLAIDRAKELFKLPEDWDVNVQALSGSNANLAVYLALLQPGDVIMGMYLPDGGHLSHGWSYDPDQAATESDVYLGGERKVNISSKMFKSVQYKVDAESKQIDYDRLAEVAKAHLPKMIITGGTAYSQDIDYKRVKEIAESVGAYYLADIAHEAGLVAAGVLNSPVGVADVVTMTTHKTLRAGRGAIILAHGDIIKKVNKAILPGLQGGPHNHNIAGICVGLGEALKPEFSKYAQQVVENAQALANQLQELGFNIVSGGTQKHLILVDLSNKRIYGKFTSRALNHAGIVLNMNTMPGETRAPSDPSAIRMGTPWLTTRGMRVGEMKQVANWIEQVVMIGEEYAELEFEAFEEAIRNDERIVRISDEVKELCKRFPLDI